MKQNIFKYIFSVIVIGLVIYAIYLIYGKNDEISNQIPEESEPEEIKMITEIKIPILKFDTINPILSKNQNVQDIARLVFEPLLDIDENYKIKLCLAKEWSKVDETSYVIKLKENIKWHDGNTLTAKDVQYTIDRLKDENVSSIYGYNVQYVIGVEVIDEYTIRINLSREIPFFEYNLNFPIMSSKYFENEDFVNTSKNEHPVGTGRFKIGMEDGNILLKRNDNWWNVGQDETKITKIHLMKYENMGEVYNEFKLQNIDMLSTKSLNMEDYIGTIGYGTKNYCGRNLDFIAFNLNNEILANKEVRKAISYGINKQNIVSGIYRDKYRVSNFPLDFGSFVYENGKIDYEYNVDKSRTALIENGWEFKSKYWQRVKDYRTQRIRLNLVVDSENAQRVSVAENIKASLEDIGFRIDISKVSNARYKKYLENKNYDMILTGVYSGYSPDLSNYFGPNNLSNFANEEVTRLLNEIKEIKDDDELLKQKYDEIIKIFNDEMPYVFLYYNTNTLVYNPKLVGEITPNSYNIFNNIGTWYVQE